MLRLDAVVALFPDLPAPEIGQWVARGWLHAEGSGPEEWSFAEIDIARIRLIRDLRVDLDVADDTVPVVLSLLDQVYGLRRTMQALLRALDTQPEPVRAAVLEAVTRRPRQPQT